MPCISIESGIEMQLMSRKCKTTLKTSTTISYDVQEINERLRFCMSKLLC